MPGPAVIAKIQTWYQSVLVWLGISEPENRKETVEDQLTEGVLKDILEAMWDYRELTSSKKRFPQVLIDGSKPSDRNVAFNHGLTVPPWGKVSIDEWEGPDGKGVSINFYVTELDASEWVLRLKWFPGESGTNYQVESMGWEEVVDETP